jgi:hypothetical protein
MYFKIVCACVAAATVLVAPAAARADDAPVTAAQMREEARAYYDAEMTASLLFAGFGGVTAGGGAVALTQPGDFARGLGGSSLILGSITAVGAGGYALAVKVRGDHYTGLAEQDLSLYQREEADHIAGTNKRFWLYLGSELLETAAGIGIAGYGLAAKNDLYKGIGIGAAIQGIGLFVIDVPGSARAAKYQDTVRRFRPDVGFSVGGGGRPWAATVGHTF